LYGFKDELVNEKCLKACFEYFFGISSGQPWLLLIVTFWCVQSENENQNTSITNSYSAMYDTQPVNTIS